MRRRLEDLILPWVNFPPLAEWIWIMPFAAPMAICQSLLVIPSSAEFSPDPCFLQSIRIKRNELRKRSHFSSVGSKSFYGLVFNATFKNGS